MSFSGAFLFDLDGVIIDSMPMHIEAWREYLRRHGFSSDGIADRMHGKRNDEIVTAFWGDGLDAGENYAHGAAKEALFREMMAPVLDAHLVPGVREFLDLHAHVPKAIGTNAEPANVDFVLDGAAIRHHFLATVDGMQVAKPKPHPDVYVKAASLLGYDARACIVFEDSPTGAAAALAAGATVVGIATHAPRLEGATITVKNFADPRLREWLSGFRI